MVRFKNRFLALEVRFNDISSGPVLSNSQIINSIRSSLSQHFGISASGALGGPLSIKYYSPQTRTILLRCARTGIETVHAAVTLMGEIAGKECRVDVVAISGTIKKLEQWVIKRDRRLVQMVREKSKSKERGVKRRQQQQQRRKQTASKLNHPQEGEDLGTSV
ncbi:unnamed protein product [Sympodiomycopsis kandeliae]